MLHLSCRMSNCSTNTKTLNEPLHFSDGSIEDVQHITPRERWRAYTHIQICVDYTLVDCEHESVQEGTNRRHCWWMQRTEMSLLKTNFWYQRTAFTCSRSNITTSLRKEWTTKDVAELEVRVLRFNETSKIPYFLQNKKYPESTTIVIQDISLRTDKLKMLHHFHSCFHSVRSMFRDSLLWESKSGPSFKQSCIPRVSTQHLQALLCSIRVLLQHIC